MEEVKLNLKLPYVEKDIIKHYNKNMEGMKMTFHKIMLREFDDSENHRLKQLCMELAIAQVTRKYQDELGINKENNE